MIGKKTFIGLQNYLNLLGESEFWQSLGVTFYYVLVSIPFGLGLALAIALMLNKIVKGIGFFRTSFFIPYITSLVSVAIVWLWIYNPKYGVLNQLLSLLGLSKQNWLEDPNLAMPAVILFLIWKNLGYNVIIYLTKLQSIDQSYYEAARIDGAGAWSQFRFITLPLLSPTTLFLLILSTIYAFQIFPSVYTLTPDGGPNNATTPVIFYLYQNAYEQFRMGYACSIAYVVFFIILLITLIQKKFIKTEIET
jgi:multiple sugar transport system permease protein